MTRPSCLALGFLAAASLLGQLVPPITFDGEPEVVGAGLVSTTKPEIRIAISPDGKRRIWGTIGWTGGPGGWDLWESVKDGDAWSKPVAVPFNSPEKDFDPSFSPEGRGVYFFSNRPGGEGGDDIWFAPLDPDRGTWGKAVNLGPNVNTKGDEWAPIVSPDGKRLLFASDGRGGKGLHDLVVSERVKGAWGPARPLDGVNSAMDDFDATWLHDGRTLVFARKAKDSEEMALWVAAWTGKGYAEPVRLGTEVNVAGGMSLGPSIDPKEPGVLYFTSFREGKGIGLLDIWRIRYRSR